MGDDRRRILFLQPNSEVGGSDLALLRLIQALDSALYAPIVVLPGDGPLVARLRAAGAELRFLPMMQLRTLRSPVYQARYLARFWPTVWRLRTIIRETRADLVQSNSLYALYGGFAALAAGVPHLWHIREIPPAIPILRPALGALVVALSHTIVCMTRACTRGLFGARAAKYPIRLLDEGLDLSVWSRSAVTKDIRAELGIDPTTPVIGFVARLDPWKGLDVFLEAASLVSQRFPDAIFLVSGDAPAGFEAYRDEMVARASQLGLVQRVKFLGWRYRLDDIPALMASLDCFCHTSVKPEPFGLVIIEAMAMGSAVIAAAAGGPLEIIQDDVCGLLTRPGDAGALADAIMALLHDPDRRERLAQAGRTRVEQAYALEPFRQSISALYRDVFATT